MRETRREVYCEFLASVYGVILGSRPTDVEGNLDNTRDLSRSLAAVRIIGSDLVRQMAQHLTSQAIHYQLEVLADDRGSDEHRAKMDKLRTATRELTYYLERLMLAISESLPALHGKNTCGISEP